MFKPHTYVRACVAVTDDKAPNDTHYVFASGLKGNVHVITESFEPSTGEVKVSASAHTLDELAGMFGVAVYEEASRNLGRGSNASKVLPRSLTTFNARRLSPVDKAIDATVLASRGLSPTHGTPTPPQIKPVTGTALEL